MFTESLITIAKTWKQPVSTNKYMKINVVYTHTMEYYSAMRKKEILPFVTIQMDLESITFSEISQKKANTVWSHLYVEFFFKPKMR